MSAILRSTIKLLTLRTYYIYMTQSKKGTLHVRKLDRVFCFHLMGLVREEFSLIRPLC